MRVANGPSFPQARFLLGATLCAAVLAAAVFAGRGDGASAGRSEVVVGDVDCSEYVSSVDAQLILQYDADIIRALLCLHNAQASGSSDVSSVDATVVLQYVAALVDHLPPILEYTGRVSRVRGVEADCIALTVQGHQYVLWDPTGLELGERVTVIGYMDPYARFCGISPLLHNIVPAPPTPTPTDTPTHTPVPTDTPRPTDTPTPTDTPIPTDTPTPTATEFAAETPTEPTPTAEPLLPTLPELPAATVALP